MKKFLFFVLTLSLFTLVSCGNKNDSSNTSNDFENTNGITGCNNTKPDSIVDSNYDDGKSVDDEMMYVACIPHEFICLGNTYVKVESSELKSFEHMIGYLINQNELDYWKSIDTDNDFIYALDISNGIFRKTYEGEEKLKDRYELYAQNETHDWLAIKNYTNDFIFFHKEEGTK